VSLSLASAGAPAPATRAGALDRGAEASGDQLGEAPSSRSETVSFEDSFDEELRAELGDLGPARASASTGGDRGGDRGADRGGDRNRRRRRR
jgi:hypothetical protein